MNLDLSGVNLYGSSQITGLRNASRSGSDRQASPEQLSLSTVGECQNHYKPLTRKIETITTYCRDCFVEPSKVLLEENCVQSSLQVLIVQDSEEDALLLVRELQREGYELRFSCVATANQMSAMLESGVWDVILAVDCLPEFCILEALALVQKKDQQQPFIIVCDPQREPLALAAMKAGADDYVTLDNLARLVPVIERELRSAERRRWHIGAEAALRASERQLRAVFNGALDAMVIVNDSGQFMEVNQAAQSFFGLTKAELLSRQMKDFLVTNSNFSQTWQTLLEKGQVTGELRMLLPNGSTRDVEYSATANLLTGLHLAVIHDITERKQAEDQLLYHAFYDSLTGLPNRAWFLNCLGRSIRQAKRSNNRLFAVLLLDLDRYQVVKYSFGHLVADQLLIATARRIGTCLSPKDMIARLGADEFAILLSDLGDWQEARDIAQRLHQELRLPFHLHECELFSTASIGIAPSSLGFEQPEDFLRAADTAMHHAKKLGGARSEEFETSMHTRAINLLQLETDLRRALERQELRLHYQPVVSLATGSITGFEALVRWQHPERGFISPLEFISVAEDTGLIIPLGAWVMREACRQLHEWQLLMAKHLPGEIMPLTMSVNLSGVQFAQPGLIAQIDEILESTAIAPSSLKLEITETVIMEAAEPATNLLLQLKKRDIQLCIDDFGTGYSSLSRLQRLPIDTLKIDKSFVGRMSLEKKKNSGGSMVVSDAALAEVEIVRTCINLAHNLGMNVVAEGVETAEQLAILRSLGCEFGQGYLFSRPVDSEKARSLFLSKFQW
ncbi:EAL domain-containing protein [Ancylothrix sp. C2]|uniref:putative bifunctional diguanylate cyclase/phosphodiesterase n=1 Tax=Ancylothrix sp. D3o TaxID=2953691 RepID=UPI0021BA565A|nr:EAL domain-containing protein [Ancylothrix sp. D3o]MCT7949448.1 EAL domain-containing protein [Ancylothrix sp. D3o]